MFLCFTVFSPHPRHWGESSLQSLFILFFMLKTNPEIVFTEACPDIEKPQDALWVPCNELR